MAMRDSILRTLVSIAGLGVIAAATHANVLHAGGYQSQEAPLIITVAALLAVGMAFAGWVWTEGRRGMAMTLALCLLAGEAYWVLLNTEREIANRAAIAAPSNDARAAHQAAQRRFTTAVTAKNAANAAIITDAAKADCASNCRMLLLAAQQAANDEWLAAGAALAGAPNVTSATPLPDHIGMAPWAWDLLLAGLRSLVVVAGSLAVGMATVPRKKQPPARLELVAATAPVTPPAPKAPPVPHSAPVEPKRPAPLPIPPPASVSNPRANVVPLTAKRHLPEGMVSEFASRRISKSEGSETALDDIYAAYRQWCETNNKAPLPAARFVPSLTAYCDATGVAAKDTGEKIYFKDVKLWAS
jgi:hypothetical protein